MTTDYFTNTTVNDLRDTFWLTRAERSDLAEAIVDLLDLTTVLPAVATNLDNVLTELGVAEARDQMWPDRTRVVREAHGYTNDVLPIRFSTAELAAISALVTLPEPLAARLAAN